MRQQKNIIFLKRRMQMLQMCTNENTIDNKVGDKSQTVCEGDTFEHEIACKVGVEDSAILISDNSCAITEESVGDKEVEDSASPEEVHEC
ncbi:hypothetical protein C0J52_14529 [Blattella germanica]|nr:hypothetical protein C0J52_14529 [Blattella germanica]